MLHGVSLQVDGATAKNPLCNHAVYARPMSGKRANALSGNWWLLACVEGEAAWT